MIAELGLFSLVLALIFAILLAAIPAWGVYNRNLKQAKAALVYAQAQFLFVVLSYISLTVCFLNNDFSVTYVLSNSSLYLPWFYKLCAVWGGHEGSMLLWVLILSFWMVAVSFFSSPLDDYFRARVLSVLGLLSVGFILFLLCTSNPFARNFSYLDSPGRDLNPLLQDPGFLFHPPMLYMGYVGFSVAFAFAIAALWAGRVERVWAQWARPWTLAAWCCLTLGITLGSWWAYRELGWGGWWFWDPVENASFMPWLAGTALIHSLAISEKRQHFIAWTLLLSIMAFSLSLIGTFLVRSGVLTSVHAFAVDPARGEYILGFLIAVIGGSLLLFALRAQTLKSTLSPGFLSKESALFLNNVLLIVSMLTVLLGTTYPLLIDGLGLGKLSVGVPYFNAVFVPIVLLLMVIMGVGIHLKWQQDHPKTILTRLAGSLFLSISLPIVLLIFFASSIKLSALIGLVMAFWVIFSTLKLMKIRIAQQGGVNLGQGFYGMVLAHIGVAVSVIGVCISSNYGAEADLKFTPGESIVFQGYTIQYINESPLKAVNYSGTKAHFVIRMGDRQSHIYPEKRVYTLGKMVMTDSAIDVNPFRDIYIALGEPFNDSAWGVRVYFKPFIRWIWAGGVLIFLGGLLALCDRRYYQKRTLNHPLTPEMLA